MILTKSKSAPEMWFVVERETFGAVASCVTTRNRALDDFTDRLAGAYQDGEGYTPFQRRRGLLVIGPDVHQRADGDDAVLYPLPRDDRDDPLVVGDAAVRSVLTASEYSLIVHGTVAQALLES